jgi:RNA polymerase sigma-70 factor (ECF subfamily)
LPGEVPVREDALKSNDRRWFEPLVRELENDALGFTMTLVHDRGLAEELLQEAFARVWASPNTPSDRPAFKRWLYHAILNLARDHARRRKRWALFKFWSPQPPDPLDEVERRADDAALVAALRLLDPRARAALHLRYFEDRSFSEVAETLGVKEPTARVIVHRALAKLRGMLGGSLAVGGVKA